MNTEAKIIDNFKRFRLGGSKTELKPAKVLAVEGEVLSVEDLEGLEIFDVRLKAAIDDNEKSFLLIPKIGSWVLIGNLNCREDEWSVVMVSELEKVVLKIDQTTFDVDANGFALARQNEDLKTLIGELLDGLAQLQVTCASPGSPSSPPINLATFQALKVRFNQLLKSP